MNVSESGIKKQFDFIESRGWLPAIRAAAKKYNLTTALLLGIGSRETNFNDQWRLEPGDGGNGFSFWQLDIRSHPEWIEGGAWKDVAKAVEKAASAFYEKQAQAISLQGKVAKVGRHSFTGAALEPDDARRVATAAYNNGLYPYYRFSIGQHVDRASSDGGGVSTTGHDYSRDVYDRAIAFSVLLDVDEERGAIAHEVALQGKYARDEHVALVPDVVDEEPIEEETLVGDDRLERIEALLMEILAEIKVISGREVEILNALGILQAKTGIK